MERNPPDREGKFYLQRFPRHPRLRVSIRPLALPAVERRASPLKVTRARYLYEIFKLTPCATTKPPVLERFEEFLTEVRGNAPITAKNKRPKK